MVNIVQISDLHYGCSDFRDEFFDNIITYLKNNIPDVIICTGDIVDKGKLIEYEGFVPYFEKLKKIAPLITVPGNHCCKASGIVWFEKFISARRSKLVIKEKDAIILGICSPRDDLKDGEIGDEQLEWMARHFKEPYENRVLALHHHLIPIPFAGRKWNIVRDAGEILEFTQYAKIDLVLCGHRHVPHAWVIGPTTFLYCGTSTSIKSRVDDSPSFNHINLDKGDLDVQIINSSTLEKSQLLTRRENHTKFIRPRKTRIEHLLNQKVFLD